MIKVTSSILTFFMLSSLALASDNTPTYDQAQLIKTQEIMALSQVLDKDHMFEVDTRITVNGRKGLFSSFGGNDDLDWKGSVFVTSQISKCFSEEYVQSIQKEGYTFKSRTADVTIAGYRAAIKELRKSGAKYVFIPEMSVKMYDDNNNSTNPTIKPFSDVFQKLLMSKKFEENTDRNLPDECFRDTSVNASDVFWIAGKLAALAVGVKGAGVGNTNMTSLASSINLATGNGSSKSEEMGLLNQKKAAGIKLKDIIILTGLIDPLYYVKRFPDNKYAGGVVPIEVIEEHLSHYPNIPYGREIIDVR